MPIGTPHLGLWLWCFHGDGVSAAIVGVSAAISLLWWCFQLLHHGCVGIVFRLLWQLHHGSMLMVLLYSDGVSNNCYCSSHWNWWESFNCYYNSLQGFPMDGRSSRTAMRGLSMLSKLWSRGVFHPKNLHTSVNASAPDYLHVCMSSVPCGEVPSTRLLGLGGWPVFIRYILFGPSQRTEFDFGISLTLIEIVVKWSKFCGRIHLGVQASRAVVFFPGDLCDL